MYRESALDEIRIENLEVFAHHGVYPEETREGQNFYVNAVLYTDTRLAGEQDELMLSTNYGEVSLFIHEWMQKYTFKLLEAVAEHLSRELLLRFPYVASLDLEIRKPHAPIPLSFSSVSVKIHRGRHRAYIALGSNMGNSKAYITNAIEAMRQHPLMEVRKVSSLITTAPYGGVEQEDFLNGALCLDTLLSPEELLEELHKIEASAGRERLVHWGPRTLDLDILFYDQLVYDSENLVIPHGDLCNREFVLEPMNEIAPYLRHPVCGKTVAVLLQELRDREQCQE